MMARAASSGLHVLAVLTSLCCAIDANHSDANMLGKAGAAERRFPTRCSLLFIATPSLASTLAQP